MAEIRPFSAYRPAPGRESRIAALPYDVYNREEAAEIVRKNPDSFLAIDRAETGFGNEVDTYAPQVYERAAGLLRERIAEGSFIREEKACYYLYEQVMNGKAQTGIVRTPGRTRSRTVLTMWMSATCRQVPFFLHTGQAMFCGS